MLFHVRLTFSLLVMCVGDRQGIKNESGLCQCDIRRFQDQNR